MRLTKKNRELLLKMNEGFVTHTNYSDRNFSEHRKYEIKDNQLHISANGKGAWSDSRYDDEWVADDAETHRFLYKYLGSLKKPTQD